MLISEAAAKRTTPTPGNPAYAPPTARSCWLVFLLLFGVALAFAVSTGHVWEDFYITYRASKNLALGHGLTFTVGERVHSFTSPLGTLLPALASLMTANRSDTGALWIFRLMSISAYAGAGVVLWRLGHRLSTHRYPAILLVALLATDAKTIDFTSNGMEAPYLLLFLGWTLYALFFSPARRAVHLGLAWAGLMWCRPDSFIYIGALSLAALAFGRFAPFWHGRGVLLKDFAIAAAITTVLYGPWVLWAWWYYGSPIPHTVIAKGLLMPTPTLHNIGVWLWDFPIRIVQTGANLGTTFLPPYALNSGWPAWQISISYWLSLLVLVFWLIPLVRWEARVTSFAFTVGHFYLNYFSGSHAPWYLPTLTFLAFFSLAGVISQAVGWFGRGAAAVGTPPSWRPHWAVLGPTLLVPVAAFLLLLATAYEMGIAQRNENGNRRVVAEWLKANARTPKDTVFIECLGYIGFFSNLKIYDYPGLCSPEVVAARRKSTTRGIYTQYFPELISALQPDWLVLRSSEVNDVKMLDRDLLTRHYLLVKVFDTSDKITAIRHLPGRNYLLFDSHFEVYHRRSEAESLPVRTVPISVDSMIEKRTWAGPAYNSKGNIAAHAPSFLTVQIPPGARSLSGQFGFFPGSYDGPQNGTPGAIFSINVVTGDGKKTQIFLGLLNPTEREKDRGDQDFVAPITVPEATLAELIIEPPLGKSNAFGWTYWTNLKFEIPRE